MKILLDTNFIITCARQGINYVSVANGLTTEDILWIVPKEVLAELKGLRKGDKLDMKDRAAIDIGLELIKELKVEVVKLSEKNVDVDSKIVEYLKGRPYVLATLDKALKKRVKNQILSVRGKKNLAFVG